MGHTCSKSAYDDAIDREHYHNPYKRHHLHGGSAGPMSAGGLSSSGSGGHHHHLSSHRSGIARTDPALFALQEQSLALYNNACWAAATTAPAAAGPVEVDADASDSHLGVESSTTAVAAVPVPTFRPQSYEANSSSLAGQHHLLYKQQQKTARQQAQLYSSARRRNRQQQHPQPVPLPLTVPPAPAVVVDTDASSSPQAQQPQQLVPNYSSRLVVRRHAVKLLEEGTTGTHIYAVRWPKDQPLSISTAAGSRRTALNGPPMQEQSPYNKHNNKSNKKDPAAAVTPRSAAAPPPAAAATTPRPPQAQAPSHPEPPLDPAAVDALFHPTTLATPPQLKLNDWVTVSEEHDIFVADVGLTAADCDRLVQVTEHVCRGQYAAYTYAKQTLGCREFPALATAVHPAVHAAVHGILTTRGSSSSTHRHNKSNKKSGSGHNNNNNNNNTSRQQQQQQLALDDREPHMVKYDVTKKERQKLDMHTDKSEWTFLISLSTGCGMDFEGGGTYFEVLDATVHVQRGHALVFPGKLRHCGQRITAGLRFLLVGFLVDKASSSQSHQRGANRDDDDEDDDDDDEDDDFPNALHLTNVP